MIRILVTGDFCPINRTEQLGLGKQFGEIYNDFLEILSGNDLNVTDLECPLTLSGRTMPKIGPHQKAHPDCIEILKFGNFNLVALANNHIMDYNGKGAGDTLELCKTNHINTIGIGRTRADAARPFIYKKQNKSVAIINCADNEFLVATDESMVGNPIDPVSLYEDILTAKRSNDFVLVIVHAGNEFYELPSPRTKKLYRHIVDLGADAVIAHHTHAISGYELYRSKPIFYGLGNFIYDWPGRLHEGWNNGFVVRLLLSEKLEFEIIPIKQSGSEPGVFQLSSLENDLFLQNIDRLNQIISNDSLLERRFIEFCESVYPAYDAYIEPYLGRYVTALRKRGLFPHFMRHRKRLLILNITRCESHRDVLVRMLENHFRWRSS